MYKFAAVFIGFLISIMVTFNGTLDGYTGNYLSILIIHIVGLITVMLTLIIRREKLIFNEKLPLYIFSGGAIGVLLVLLNNLCFGSLGVSLTLALGVFGQLVLSIIIDNFGLFGMDMYKFNKKKLIGFAIMLIGIVVMTVY
jgi:bacterial/archaeal transporter family-2 protein